jgi:hypothetical protein
MFIAKTSRHRHRCFRVIGRAIRPTALPATTTLFAVSSLVRRARVPRAGNRGSAEAPAVPHGRFTKPDAVAAALAGVDAQSAVNNAGIGVMKPFMSWTRDGSGRGWSTSTSTR